MLTKMTRNNQVTIPRAIVNQIGLRAGSDYLEVVYNNGRIVMKPVTIEEKIPVEALRKLVKRAGQRRRGDVEIKAGAADGFLARRRSRNK